MKHSDYLKKKKIRETRKKIISVISAIVVFITTYALVLPAITLDVSKASQEPGIAYEQMQFKATAAAASVTAADSTVEEAQVEEPAAEEPEEEPAEEIKEEEPAETPEEEASAVSAEEEKEEEPAEEAPAEPEQEEAPAQEAPEVQEDKSEADSADEKSSEPAPEKAEDADAQKTAEDTAVDQSGTAVTDAAAAATTAETAAEFKIPELDALDFDDILTGKTAFYYYHPENEEEAEDLSSDSIEDWKKVGSDTVLAPEDFVRVYLSYEIPAGALNETNAVARYRLPAGLELSDKQIKAINKYENGIAASKSGSDQDKYLGAEAIEGSRTPDEKADDEYIAATVKVKKTDSGRQELVFTFIPYTVEKNQISYDEKGEVKSKGKEVKGFFSFDLKTSQIDFEKTNTETVEKEDGTTEEIQYSEAKVVFADKDSNWIERALTLAVPVEKDETQAAEPKTLTSEGPDYTVTVSYTDEAQIPDNAALTVSEIGKDTPEYETYLEQAKGAVGDENKSVNEARFFDITIMADGEKVEPQAPVSVQINFAGIEQTNTDDTQLLHYKDSEDVEVMDKAEFSKSEEQTVDTVQFETEGFSVYGIVGTGTITDTFTLPGSDDEYEVSVTYGADAGIPENVHLEVAALSADSEEYVKAKEAVVADKKAKDAEFDEINLGFAALDISIADESGKKVEPAEGAEVKVSIKLKKLPEGTDEAVLNDTLEVLHLNESTGTIVVETVADAQNVIVVDGTAEAEFTIDSFSTFPLTWDDGSATIHYGYLNTETHQFVDFEEDKVATLDTSVATVNLANTFEGYSYIGCEYKESSTADLYDMTSSILTRTENGWQITHKTSHEEGAETVTENIANGSEIYVYYGEPKTNPQTPTGAEIPTPITDKSVVVNEDGTATITLDITGTKVTETDSKGANVLLVLDTTYSMASSMTGAANRFEAARSAALTLIDTLDCGTNDIELSLVEFNSTGTIKYNWTKDYTNFRNYIANTVQHASGPTGTNWESGLYYARQVLNSKDADDTYVIFLTDGEPNRRGTTTSTNAGTSTAISYALAQAQAITGTSNTSLYGVFCGSSSGYNNLNNMINDAGGVGTINGTDAGGIRDAFEDIAHTIISNLGAAGVSVDDGVTNLSSVSATVTGTAGGYKYYYKDEGATEWVEWTEDNGAPGASYSEDNGVTWDLSAAGTLQAGRTYRVQFTVWPSQEALDLIANLNNGTVSYEDLDDDVKAQITGDKTSGYTLATNTHLNTTYTFKGNTYTDPKTPLPSGEMPLLSEQMTVRKAFAHSINSQDPFTSIEFYLKVDGKYYQNDGTTSSTLDDSKVVKLPVNTDNDWENHIYIAPGFMEGEEVLESGHKYSLEEKVLIGSEYEYEFTPQTVRPMIIDGTLTYLVLVDEYNAPGKNGVPANAKTYTIDGETYYVASENSGELVGTNRKTAELDITKVVETNGILTDEEEAEETFTYRVTLQIPDGTDPAGIVGYEYVYRPNQDNAYYLYGYHQYEEGTPVASAFADDIARLGNNKYRAWNTLIYRDLVEWETVDGKIVSKRDGDGNIIWKVPASGGYHTITYDMTLKQNEVIRFTNLPTGTKYTIQEIYANKYPADNVGGDTAGKTPVSDPSNIAAEGYEISIRNTAGTVSGDTVSGTIEGLDTRFYNQFTNTMTKTVDVNLAGTKKLDGYNWSGESYHFTLATTGSNPMPPASTGKTEFDLTAASGNADQTDTFGRLRFTAPGTYTYTVSETNAGTLQIVNGKAVQFGNSATVTIVIAEDPDTHELSVESVTGAEWNAETSTATASITNTAPTTQVTATKVWENADGTSTAPANAKVTFTLYADGDPVSPAKTVELDGTVDENGEATAWVATFSGLQQYKIVEGETEPVPITYTIGETGTWTGYELVTINPVSSGETITNKQMVQKVQFVKEDAASTNTKLSGAVFTFSIGNIAYTVTSDATGLMKTADGTDAFELPVTATPYVMRETTAPAGYDKLTGDVLVTSRADGISAGRSDDSTVSYKVDAPTTDNPNYVVHITNSSGVELPMTGGPGTFLYTLGGIVLIMASALMYGFRMRRRERRLN